MSYSTVRLSGYGSISHEAKSNRLSGDPWPLRAKGLIVLVSPN